MIPIRATCKYIYHRIGWVTPKRQPNQRVPVWYRREIPRNKYD